MKRKIYYWKLRESELQLGERTLIMGVLNVTPDSFSDGGLYNNPDRAYARALELEEQGADIIDIGGESTKPGSQRITPDEEWQRLVPVLKRLRGNLRVPLSLDSYKSEIAERSLEYGVQIFNDPSGLTFDPHLAKVAANANAGLILNHMRGLPETWPKQPPMQDPIGTIGRELEATASRARHSGVERNRIVVDPGLGFGKRKEQNAEILARLEELAALDFPILVGPSRKSFLAQTTENETLFATAAAVSAAVLNGAHIIRVHDVKEMHTVVALSDEIARAANLKPAPAEDERPTPRPRPQSQRPPVDIDRPRPTRPPMAVKPAAAVPPPAEAPAEAPAPPRPTYPARDKREDRDKREGGWRPPSRPFKPRRDDERSERRPDDRGAKPRFSPKGPRPPFRRDDDRPARPRPTGDRPPRGEFKPRGDFKPRSFKPREGDSRPPRSGPPRSGPPRSGPPRSGPPRGGRPSGPPKRPFRKRP